METQKKIKREIIRLEKSIKVLQSITPLMGNQNSHVGLLIRDIRLEEMKRRVLLDQLYPLPDYGN